MRDAPARRRLSVGEHVGRLGRACGTVVLVAWFAFAIVVLALRYVVLPQVAAHRVDIERLVSRAVDEQVTIGTIEASWRGLRPSLALGQVRIVDRSGRNTLDLPAVRATLSWESLAVLDLRLSALEVDGLDVLIRRDPAGQISVAGFPVKHSESPHSRVLEWVMAQHLIRIHDARVVWRDEMPVGNRSDVREVALSHVTVALARTGWRHQFALTATPPATLGAPLDVRAVLDHPLLATRFAEPDDWRGEIYTDVASGDIAAWRAVVPLPETLESGRGRVRTWIRFERADAPPAAGAKQPTVVSPALAADAVLKRVRDVVTDLALDDVAVRWGPTDRIALAAIDGRVSAFQSADEQRVGVRGLVLKPVKGEALASTDLTIRRKLAKVPADETGEATLNAIDLEHALGLVPVEMLPPAVVEKLAAYRPRGVLDQVALRWKGPVVSPASFDFDARFKGLGLAAQAPTAEAIRAAAATAVGPTGQARKPRPPFGQPGFENLSGTVNATREADASGPVTRATIAVDATDVGLTTPGLFDDPDLRLARLQAKVALRIAGEDLEVKVGDAVVENADLAGTADVTFRRGPHSGSERRGWIDVDARLSRAEVGRVPRYLPNLVGEGARQYLRKSLISGRVTEATFRMRGALEKLNFRGTPDAYARPNPVPLTAALAAIRDGRRLPAAHEEKSDEAMLHAVVKVKDATYLYGPARSAEEIAESARSHGETLPQPVLPTVAWPAFEDVDADVIFDRADMTIVARSARTGRFRLNDVRVDLPALADPAHVLRAVGKGSGPLQDLFRFVNASPMARWTRNAFASTEATGNATLALALDLPLGHARDAEVQGSIGLSNNDIQVVPVAPPLTQLAGRVDFSDHGLAIANLTGSALGGPMRVDAKTGNDGLIEINGEGAIDARALRAPDRSGEGPSAAGTSKVLQQIAQRLDGTAKYRLAVRLHAKRIGDAAASVPTPSGTPAQPDLLVESNLAGLAIDLPPPFAKTAAKTWPVRVTLDRDMAATTALGANTETLRVAIADKAQAEIVRRRNAQGQLVVARAAYGIGSEPLPPGDGPTILRAAVPALDLDAWRDVVRQVVVPRPAGAEPTVSNTSLEALVPERIALKTDELRVAGRSFGHVELDTHRVPSGWEGDVKSDQIGGHLAYSDVSGSASTRSGVAPVSSGRLVARLTHLVIPKSESSREHVEGTLEAGRQRDFPAIDLIADRFELRGHDLGRLEVEAVNVGDDRRREWKLEKLGLTMPEANFTAHGTWGRGTGGEDTHLDFALDASNVGDLLDRLGIRKTIKDGSTKMTGQVGWKGGPTSIDYASMTGRLDLDAGKGQFLKADPGIAKLLGVLSLQAIPRRLMFDFTDVFEAGFAFDRITAHAAIDQGVAKTDDFKMTGVQANVLMSGTADLERETTNLNVLVLPEINAGAASLGLAVVNPVIGLATFAAQVLLKDPIARALSFEYNVSGPWAKPVVSKVDRDGKATPVVTKSPSGN